MTALELTENLDIVSQFMNAFKEKYSKSLALYIASEIGPKTLVLDDDHHILADLDYEDKEKASQMINLAAVYDYIHKEHDLDAIAELFH